MQHLLRCNGMAAGALGKPQPLCPPGWCSWMVARVLLFLKFFHHVAAHHHEFSLVRSCQQPRSCLLSACSGVRLVVLLALAVSSNIGWRHSPVCPGPPVHSWLCTP